MPDDHRLYWSTNGHVGDVVNNASVNMILWHASSGAITARTLFQSCVSRRHPRVTAQTTVGLIGYRLAALVPRPVRS